MIRVAIVGAGPKGLFAAERLAAHLTVSDAAASITVFDPQPPGWGAGYDADQPHWLRLNVNAAIVDMDGGRNTGVSLGLPDFAEWRRGAGETEPLDPFPPRATVGHYLAHCWGQLLERVPARVRLRHVARRVDRLDAIGDGWLIDHEYYDEVLMCTGHAQDWPGALRHGWAGPAPLVPQVYPVRTWLTSAAVPAGGTVVCRGAALTFIDACLSLTEGRDGRFDRNGYHRSGSEPSRIVPVARRGGFMEVKPQPDGPLAALPLEQFRRRGLARCAEAGGQVDVVLAAVWQTAGDYLCVAAGGAVSVPPVGVVPPPDDDPVTALRRSLRVAMGECRPGLAWALGQAWRDLYSGVVRALGHQQVTQSAWSSFASAAAALEPIAFGPPPVNAAKLLALCDAGLVDASFLAGRWSDALHDADVVIDCVLPPPGLVEGELAADLMERGLVAKAAGRRGVSVAPDATCLTSDGTPIGGLAALGRLTEDVVIGNDTLSRTLHPSAARWAQRVDARCASVVVGGGR